MVVLLVHVRRDGVYRLYTYGLATVLKQSLVNQPALDSFSFSGFLVRIACMRSAAVC